MAQTIKFTISDENYQKLLERAGDQSVQDFIRSVLFPDQVNPITPEIAVTKALSKYSKGDTFTVPDIFGDEWNLTNGYAGVFGKRFYNLVKDDYSDKIKFTETFNRRGLAIYKIL